MASYGFLNVAVGPPGRISTVPVSPEVPPLIVHTFATHEIVRGGGAGATTAKLSDPTYPVQLGIVDTQEVNLTCIHVQPSELTTWAALVTVPVAPEGSCPSKVP